MKVTAMIPTEQVTDVLCDVCGTGTASACGPEFGTLQAHWGYGSQHDTERYEVHLCESCFFGTLAYLRQEHRINNMFAEDYRPAEPEYFGRQDLGLREAMDEFLALTYWCRVAQLIGALQDGLLPDRAAYLDALELLARCDDLPLPLEPKQATQLEVLRGATAAWAANHPVN